MNEPPSLLRNDVSGGGRWLKVLLVGTTSNRSAIGARVTARYGDESQAQEVQAQSSFYSSNDRRLHFGPRHGGVRRAHDPLAERGRGEDPERRGRSARRHPRRRRHRAPAEARAMTPSLRDRGRPLP
jgi:hypothetical protein